MKNLIIALIFIPVFFTACSKSGDDGDAILTFKANGKAYDWSGKSATNYSMLTKRISSDTADIYTLFAVKGTTTDTANWASLNIGVTTHKLEIKTYNDPFILIALNADLKNYGLLYGDSGEFTVTKIHNGMADGTFTFSIGNMSAPFIKVTDGVFRNMLIITE